MIDSVSNAGGVAGSSANYSEMTLDELMTLVMSERTEVLDEQIRDRIAELDAKNQQLQKLNTSVAEVSNNITELDDDTDTKKTVSPETNAMIQSHAGDYYKSDGKYNKEDLEKIKETMKTAADNLSSTSQLDMTKLQSTMNKYNQSFELLSNFISKYAQSLNSIIGNMR